MITLKKVLQSPKAPGVSFIFSSNIKRLSIEFEELSKSLALSVRLSAQSELYTFLAIRLHLSDLCVVRLVNIKALDTR